MASFMGVLFLMALGGWSADALSLRVHPANTWSMQRTTSSVGARVMSKLMMMDGMDNATALAIVNAMHPNVPEEQCDHFDRSSSGGGGASYAWCEKAINKVIANDTREWLQPKGLSYGIFTFDSWSEGMSNKYHVPTELFDCYSTSKNSELHTKHGFESPSTRHDVCVGSKAQTDKDGRVFETMAMHLEGRKPLSTFVKMDVEGSEWEVIADLLKNKEDLNKVATLDFELHFCMKTEGHDILNLLEGLSGAFAITDVWDGHADHQILLDREKKVTCKPTAMVSISYVNKKLL